MKESPSHNIDLIQKELTNRFWPFDELTLHLQLRNPP